MISLSASTSAASSGRPVCPNGASLTFLNEGTVRLNAREGAGAGPVVPSGTFTNRGVFDRAAQSPFFGQGGHVRPGTSPGIFTIGGAPSFNATSLVHIEIGGLTAVTQYDRLVFSTAQSVYFGGTLDVTSIDGFVPNIGDHFTVPIYTAGCTSDFSTETLPTLPGDRHWVYTKTETGVVLSVQALR